MNAFRTADELAAFEPTLRQAPREFGLLDLVVCRPDPAKRTILEEGYLSVTDGLVGDSWSTRRRPHLDAQITVMSARMVVFLADRPEQQALAGDQLYVDLDLSHENLPAGSRLSIGNAVIELTGRPHAGCAKFVSRFGVEAMQFVNGQVGKELRLRGFNARVVTEGVVRPGDKVTKL